MTTTINHKQKTVVGVRLTAEEIQQIDDLAGKDRRTRSGYLRKIILAHLGEVEK